MAITITQFDGAGVTTRRTPYASIVDAVDSVKQAASGKYNVVRVVALGPRSADVWAYNESGPGWDGVVYAIQMEDN